MLRIIRKGFKKIFDFVISTIAYSKLLFLKKHEEAIFLTSLAIGDVVYGLAYIEEYKKQNPNKAVVIIADEQKKDIIEYYNGIDEVRYFNKNTFWGTAYLLKLNASTYYANKGIKNCIYNTIPWVIYGYKNNRNDCLLLLRRIMQLPDNIDPTYPKSNKINKFSSVAEFDIIKRRMVIINPYSANKTQSECQKLLESLIPYLKKKGFVIYCNAIGNQPVISGAERLSCTIQELYSIAEEIPLIISIRSGIMDYLVATKAKKMVIYPSVKTKSFKDMYGMTPWGVDNIWEFSISETQEFSTEIKTFIDEIEEGME